MATDMSTHTVEPSTQLTPHEIRLRIQQKHEYSRALLQLAQTQQTLVDDQQYDQLIGLLQQKQTLIEAIQAVSELQPSLLDQWRSTRSQFDPTSRQECETWLAYTEQNLQQMLQSDHACTTQMQTRRDRTQAQLAAVSESLNVQDAYQTPAHSSRMDLNG